MVRTPKGTSFWLRIRICRVYVCGQHAQSDRTCVADSPQRSRPQQSLARPNMSTAGCSRTASGSWWRRSPSPLHVRGVNPTRRCTIAIVHTRVEDLRGGRDGRGDLLAYRGHICRLRVGHPEGRNDRKCVKNGAPHDVTSTPSSSGSRSRRTKKRNTLRETVICGVFCHNHLSQARWRSHHSRGGGLPRFSRVEFPPPRDRDKHVDHPKIGKVRLLTCMTPLVIAARRSRGSDPRCKDSRHVGVN